MRTDARNNPVTSSKELGNTSDMEMRQPGPVTMALDTELDREDIVVAQPQDNQKDYDAAIAFMEEDLVILLSKPSEKNSAALIDLRVNGIVKWVRVGVPQVLKRKYVEVLARSQPWDVQTDVKQHAKHETNDVIRTPINKYPFSVMEDPSGARGMAWLQQVMYEA